ncbi:MAG: nucleotidyltransferase family protein [Flammeovirgaceae bacterium]|nr:nucleotidyltransferase family protein [Flammeovirgaceae bacterium]
METKRTEESDVGIIILAAGSSSRLGQPKQLLKLGNESLLRKISKNALDSAAGNVVVVLGSNAEKIKSELKGLNLHIVFNKSWEQGMSTSINIGLEKQLEDLPATLSGVLFLVCDQPFVSSALINNLLSAYLKTKKGIIGSKYQSGTIGVPVLFSSEYFPNLLDLKGNEGARKIIKSNTADVSEIPFLKGDLDIDTISDWESFQHNHQF